MKQHRAPALNRFEADLARAIDERTARSTLRRHARLAVLGVLVLAGTTAGVAYAWTRPVHHSSEIATSGPAEDARASTSAVPAVAENGSPVVLDQGTVEGRDWILQLAANGSGDTCLVLVWSTGSDSSQSFCAPAGDFARAVDQFSVVALRTHDGLVVGGAASPDVTSIVLLDAKGVAVATAPATPSEALSGIDQWAIDNLTGTPATIVALDANGRELYRESAIFLVGSDAPGLEMARQVEHAAKAAIVGIDGEDQDVYIDNPEGLAETRAGLAALYPEQVGHTTFVLRSITFSSETDAEFVYDILLAPPFDDRPLLGLVGHAVRIDGVWKVTRATACQAWNWGGGSC